MSQPVGLVRRLETLEQTTSLEWRAEARFWGTKKEVNEETFIHILFVRSSAMNQVENDSWSKVKQSMSESI